MKNTLKIILLAFMLTLFTSTAVANDSRTNSAIEIPASANINKDNDLSAALLSNIIGDPWKTLVGGDASDSLGGMGKYSGVLVMFLEVSNLIALTFIAICLMYRYMIISVTTAHNGKKIGDGEEDAVWLPIRGALALCLCTPVLNGLSFLQIIMISCISFGINIANNAWDVAGDYIIQHTQAGIIDNSPPFIEEESLSLIAPMFKMAVLQEVARGGSSLPPVKEKEMPKFSANSNDFYQVLAADEGRLMVTYSPLKGLATVQPVVPVYKTSHAYFENKWSQGDFGKVAITAYEISGKKDDEVDPVLAKAFMGITQARIDATVEMWIDVRKWALHYLSDNKWGYQGMEDDDDLTTRHEFPRPEIDALEIARKYRESVMKASEEHLAVVRQQAEIQGMLQKSLDNKDGKSRIGWVSAGLFPYSLAKTQQYVDQVTFGRESSVVGGRNINHEVFFEENAKYVKYAENWCIEEMLHGRIYNSVGEDGDGPGAINQLIAGIFMGESYDGRDMSEMLDNRGILATTLKNFQSADPIVVISDFGNKLYQIGGKGAAVSLAASGLAAVADYIPFLGSKIANTLTKVTTNPVVVTGLLAILAVGITLYFVAPFLVFTIWAWALMKWLLTVIYALLAGPFWACSHIFSGGGRGFAGAHAKKGYIMLLDIVCRPFFLVFGAVTSIAVLLGASFLYSTLLAKFFNAANMGNGVITELIFSIIVVSLFYYIYAKIFTFCISQGPDAVINWLGQVGAGTLSTSENEGGGQQINVVAGAVVGRASGIAGTAMQQGAHGSSLNKGKNGDQKPNALEGRISRGDNPGQISPIGQ